MFRLRAMIPAFVVVLSVTTVSVLGSDPPGKTSWDDREERFRSFIDFRSMVKGGSVSPHWIDEGARFWYAENREDGTVYVTVDAATGERTESAEPPVQVDTPPPTDPGEDPVSPSPDGRWTVRSRDNNLWLQGEGEEPPVQLTFDGETDHEWSASGVYWSGDGRRFVVERYDVRGVHKIPVVDWLGYTETVEWNPYAYTGGRYYQTSLYMVDPAARSVKRIDTGEERDQVLSVLGWREDDSELLFIRFGRGMKQMDLLAVDPVAGGVRSIVSDRQETFIEGLHFSLAPDVFYFPVGDGEHFTWKSERDGWAHFYLYRYDGTPVRQLTRGEYPVNKMLAYDPDGGWFYFLAQGDPERPYDRHLYRVDLLGEKTEQLTEGTGQHSVSISPSFTGFVNNHSAIDRPPRAELRRMDGSDPTVLADADISALREIGWKPPEEFVVKAADGITDIRGVMYKPHDFDPSKKYPLIEIIYAGSLMTAAPNRFVPREYGHFAQVLAQLNFVTVVLDSPGTPGRSKVYQDAIYRRIGQVEIPDHVAALRQLGERHDYLDMDRVGVHGKSWGGYFALRAMLQAPDFYRVGVASAVVAELETTAYSPVVPYMELPEENPEGYDLANCLKMADRLEGKLLITAATGDLNTPFAQAMKMIEAFIRAGKPVDVMIFPGQHHWLEGASLDHFYTMLKDYFVEHLRPEGAALQGS